MSFLLEKGIFHCYVSFAEGIYYFSTTELRRVAKVPGHNSDVARCHSSIPGVFGGGFSYGRPNGPKKNGGVVITPGQSPVFFWTIYRSYIPIWGGFFWNATGYLESSHLRYAIGMPLNYKSLTGFWPIQVGWNNPSYPVFLRPFIGFGEEFLESEWIPWI